MRYASLGTASIEIPQANRAWANIFELLPVVTNTGKARNDTVRAKCASGARHLQRAIQSICLETELMTPRQDLAKNHRPLTNVPKYGRI